MAGKSDINGDGHIDILLASYLNHSTHYNSGLVFVIHGPFGEEEASMHQRSVAKISGEAIAAFVTLIGGFEGNEELIITLRQHVSDKIGPIAKPKSIVITNDLPKTRSGKIMRRLLKDISEERKLGDVTTLANADIVSELQTRSLESDDE